MDRLRWDCASPKRWRLRHACVGDALQTAESRSWRRGIICSMAAVADAILEKIPHLPESPGVYLWRDADGTVLYVGKAQRLRSRGRSYVNNDQLTSIKTRAL